MKLYIYGDSFGSFTQPEEHWQSSKLPDENLYWQKRLQVKLGCDEVVNKAIPGSSLDFTQWLFNENLSEISKDDYIVVIHTEASRRWFIEDFPNITNFQSFINFPGGEINWPWIDNITARKTGIDKNKMIKQAEIAKDYCLHVADSGMEDLYGSAIASWFKDIQQQGYKLINIPAYNVQSVKDWNVGFNTTGFLEHVSISEFVPEPLFVSDEHNDARINFIQITQGQDGRIGHLSMANHDIFLDKVYNSFMNGEDLDLDVGFESNFITKDNWEEYNDYGVHPIKVQKKTTLYK